MTDSNYYTDKKNAGLVNAKLLEVMHANLNPNTKIKFL